MTTKDIGPEMFFILRIYQMTEAELAEEIESDRDLVRQRDSTRRLARKLRHREPTTSPTASGTEKAAA